MQSYIVIKSRNGLPVQAQRPPLPVYIVEEGVKPPFCGAYLYDVVTDVFEARPTPEETTTSTAASATTTTTKTTAHTSKQTEKTENTAKTEPTSKLLLSYLPQLNACVNIFIVGLTGGLATGKSTVLSIFRDNGVAVIDADQIARKVLEPGTSGWLELRQHFGDIVFHPDGKVNRATLGEIVFDNIEKRKLLNAITHPRIQSAMMRMAVAYFFAGHSYIVMEVPLLFETGKMISFMHKIITVVCEDNQQLERLCKRSDFSEEIAKKRITCQMPLDEKVANSHFVIDNSGDIDGTRTQTESIIRVLSRSRFTWYFRAALSAGLIGIMFGSTYLIRMFQ